MSIMPEDWENLVIETGVDSLLNYLAENEKASIKEISNEIGVEKPRVKEWADGLAEENLIEKHHTLTSGLVLEYTEDNLEESQKKKQEIEEELDSRTDELRQQLEEKSELVEEKREELLNEKESLSKDEKEQVVEDTVARLEVLEDKIDHQLRSEELDYDALKLVNEIERVLYQVEELIKKHLDDEQDKKLNKKTDEAVEQVKKVLRAAEKQDGLSEEEQEIRKKLKTMEKLEEKIRKAEESMDEKEKSGHGIKHRLMSLSPFKKKTEASEEESLEDSGEETELEGTTSIQESNKIKKKDFPENSYEELVDENRVTEVMRKISLLKDPNYEAILNAELNKRNRTDLVEYLEERIQDGG